MRADLNLSLDELRLLRKSVSKTLDAESKKLIRLKPDTHVYREVQADFMTLSGVDADIAEAIENIVNK